MLYQCIDEHFYGSSQRRHKIVQARQRQILTGFDAHVLVNVLEADHEASISSGFKENYFSFLDGLMQEVAMRN